MGGGRKNTTVLSKHPPKNTRPTWQSVDLDMPVLLSKKANSQRKAWPVGDAGVEHRDWERQEVREISFPPKDSQVSVDILSSPPPILHAAVQTRVP